MNRIQTIGRREAKDVREALQETLTEWGDDLNLSAEVGGGTFTDTEVTFRVKFNVKRLDAATKKRTENRFRVEADMLGLKKAVKVGASVVLRGRAFTVVGISLSRPKYAVQCKRMDNGKVYGVPVDSINAAIGRKVS